MQWSARCEQHTAMKQMTDQTCGANKQTNLDLGVHSDRKKGEAIARCVNCKASYKLKSVTPLTEEVDVYCIWTDECKKEKVGIFAANENEAAIDDMPNIDFDVPRDLGADEEYYEGGEDDGRPIGDAEQLSERDEEEGEDVEEEEEEDDLAEYEPPAKKAEHSSEHRHHHHKHRHEEPEPEPEPEPEEDEDEDELRAVAEAVGDDELRDVAADWDGK